MNGNKKTPATNNAQTTPTSWARSGLPLAARLEPVILVHRYIHQRKNCKFQ